MFLIIYLIAERGIAYAAEKRRKNILNLFITKIFISIFATFDLKNFVKCRISCKN